MRYRNLCLTNLLLIYCLFYLPSCSKENDNKEVYQVTLSANQDETKTFKKDLLTFKLNVNKGDTILKALEYNNLATSNYNKIINYSYGEFQSWYKDSESAFDLDIDNKIDINTYKVNNDLVLYAGYIYNDYTPLLKNNISSYLGNYMALSYSSLPFISTSELPALSEDYKEVTFKHIDDITYDNFKIDLLKKYAFKLKKDGSYDDKFKAYNLKLDYMKESEELKLTYNFNDERNKFPSNFVSSQFFLKDTRDILNDNYFYVADYSKENNFITSYEVKGNGDLYKYFSYYPNSDVDPVSDFYDCLEKNGLTTTIKSSNYTYAVDESYSILITANYQNEMVNVTLLSLATTSLDIDELKKSYLDITTYEFEEDLFPLINKVKGFGSILSGYLNNNGVIGFYVSGLDENSLDNYLEQLNSLSYQGDVNQYNNSYIYSYSYNRNELNIQITYYDKKLNNNLFDNYAIFYFSHPGDIDKNVSNWINKQSKGDSEIESLPLINGKGAYRSGYIINNNSLLGYTYYMSVSKAITTKEEYIEAIKETSLWEIDNNNTTSTMTIFNSKDKVFTLGIIEEDEDLTIRLIYNYHKDLEKPSLTDVMKYVNYRLGTGDNFLVPGLDKIINGSKDIQLEEYYDGDYDRVIIYLPLSNYNQYISYENIFVEAFTNSEDFKNIGTNSDGSVTFFQEKNNGVISYYAGLSSYYIIGLYK